MLKTEYQVEIVNLTIFWRLLCIFMYVFLPFVSNVVLQVYKGLEWSNWICPLSGKNCHNGWKRLQAC